MMRSLYAGVSGLKTHQTRMDVIGNNIANVNTVAYKSMSMTFSELMYQTTQSASGPNATTGTAGINAKQIGLGVTSGAINTSITTAGGTQTTGNPFDMKISGDAFFIVSDGTSNYFTRDGSFYVDAAGNLAMQSTGYNVMGWGVDENGDIKQDTVTALKVLSADNMTYPAEATSKAYLTGIIDKLDSSVTSTSGKTVNLEFYDNLGYKYTAKYAIKELGTSGSGTSETRDYSIVLSDIVDADGNSVMSTYPNVDIGEKINYTYSSPEALTVPTTVTAMTNTGGITIAGTEIKYTDMFDSSGRATSSLDTIAEAYGYSTTNFLNLTLNDNSGNPTTVGTILEELAAGTTTNYTQLQNALLNGTSTITGMNTTVLKYSTGDGSFSGVNTAGTTSFTLDFNASYTNFSDIKVDLSTTSNVNNSGSSTIAAKTGTTASSTDGSGRKVGTLNGISVENTGIIYASYSNGQSKVIGQIAVAEFSNASGLEKEGDNLYSATANSGDFDGVGVDVTTLSGGAITTGVLEMSNVDLSSEFTEMITTQRGFQANSRIITVSDTMLEELVNLKR